LHCIGLGLVLSSLSVIFYLLADSKKLKKQTLPSAVGAARATREERLGRLDPDSPIESASQDLLSRSALVDSLAGTIVEFGAPVVALEGDYGDGKSSVLNLLRERLAGDAIVVTFTTWLPRAEDTLVRDLFNDISAECRRFYYVPQLRSRLLTYAKTISGSL